MGEPLYRVQMRDGHQFANLTHEETLSLMSGENAKEWFMITLMGYSEDCNQENTEPRETWKM